MCDRAGFFEGRKVGGNESTVSVRTQRAAKAAASQVLRFSILTQKENL